MNKKGGMDWELVALVIAVIVGLILAIKFGPMLLHLGTGATGPVEEVGKAAIP
jgi:hypothetical protein